MQRWAPCGAQSSFQAPFSGERGGGDCGSVAWLYEAGGAGVAVGRKGLVVGTQFLAARFCKGLTV